MVIVGYIRCCYQLIRHTQLRREIQVPAMGKKKLMKRPTTFKSGYWKKKKESGLCQGDDINEQPDQPKKAWKRLPLDLHNDTVQYSADGTMECIVDSYGCITGQKLLRPSPSQKPIAEKYSEVNEENDPDRKTYRLLQLRATELLWNEAMAEHFPPPPCKGMLVWDLEKEVQRGLGWREQLKCTCGHYVSRRHNLYEEVENTGTRGPKIAAPNVGIQVGLANSMTATTSFRNTLMAANIPPPSARGMQRSANRVSETITHLNEQDMAAQRKHVRDINEARGLGRDAPIRAEGDGRYNNPLRSGGGRTPFQPATQSVYTIIENVTKAKKILSVNTANKLCSKRCIDNEHRTHGCKKNIATADQIGDEEKWARQAYVKMTDDSEEGPMKISHFTSDGDSKAVKGIQEAQGRYRVKHLRDTHHLSKSISSAISNCNFSKMMMPGCTKALQTKVQKQFAYDLRRRVHGEFEQAYSHFNGDIVAMKKHFPQCIDAIIACYGGSCGKLCAKHSLVCAGLKFKKWNHSSYLRFMRGDSLQPSESDIKMLRSVLEIRLGPEAVNSQEFNTNTQMSEATNRTFSRTNPKLVTFSHNFEGRIHSAVHLRNHGIGESVILKCDAAKVPIVKGSKVAKALCREQREEKLRSAYHKTSQAKASRRSARLLQYQAYHEKLKENEIEAYQKNMLDNQKFSIGVEHCYATRRTTSGDHGYSTIKL